MERDRRLEAEVDEALATPEEHGGESESTGAEEASKPELRKSLEGREALREKAILAENLAIQQLEIDLGGEIRRHVSLKQRFDLAFDGVFIGDKGRPIVLIEVKYTQTPYLAATVLQAIAERAHDFARGVGLELGSRVVMLLAVVAEMSEDARLKLASDLRYRFSGTGKEVRVYDLEALSLQAKSRNSRDKDETSTEGS